MVTKKDDENENKVIKIKATTGAWWKSTSVDEPDQKTEAKEPGKGVKQKTARSADAVKAKRSPRKKAEPPKTQKVTEAPVDTSAVDQDQKSSKPAAASKRAPRKTAAKRKPAKAAGKTDKPKEKQQLDQEKQAVQDPVRQEAEKETAQSAQPLPEESPAEVKKTRSSSRGRRGRRSKKKVTSDEPTDQDLVAQDGSVIDQAMTEEQPQPQESDPDGDTEAAAADESDPSKGRRARSAEADTIEETKKVCKLLINAEEPEECRLALLEDGRLESIHVSTIGRTQTKNNIYKARIVAIEPSLQAAFVDYGTDKNGFLPFSEIHPEYYKPGLSEEVLHLVETHQWKKLNITEVLEKGQEILAQVVKEEVGKKGANMTTFLSIPGRCVVLMPGSESAGISRKISGEQRRTQLRDTMKSIDLPEGIGWIVRTASVDITQEALARDVKYLLKLWEDIKARGQEIDGVGLVYEDHQSVLRFLREHFDPSIQEILVDDRTALEQVKAFIDMLPKEHRDVKVRLHQGARPIFNQYSVEDQIESIYQPQVNLPSGGSIVIDPTEALVAIDVNSGSTSKGKNFEASIFQANMEAASELARQLRLRDLGGLIVVDFIDMRSKKNILAVEKQVKAAMKKDKAKVDFSRISKFGLMQISRQKLGAPIEAGNYQRCEHCKGRGTVRSVETLSLYYLRRIQTGASRKPVERVECILPLDVASYLLNNKRSELHDMESRYDVEIIINADPGLKPMDNELIFHKAEKESNSKKQA